MGSCVVNRRRRIPLAGLFRIEPYRLVVVGDGAVVGALVAIGDAAVVVSRGIFRIIYLSFNIGKTSAQLASALLDGAPFALRQT